MTQLVGVPAHVLKFHFYQFIGSKTVSSRNYKLYLATGKVQKVILSKPSKLAKTDYNLGYLIAYKDF